jgi:hypothetical protein
MLTAASLVRKGLSGRPGLAPSTFIFLPSMVVDTYNLSYVRSRGRRITVLVQPDQAKV